MDGSSGRVQRADFEVQSELNARILPGDFGGLAKASSNDDPVAADDLFGFGKRAVGGDARLGNHRDVGGEPRAAFKATLMDLLLIPLVKLVDGGFDVVLR